jgi:hypothetical protein
MLTKTKTELYRLKEAFENFRPGEIIKVLNPDAWPAFRLSAEPVSADTTWHHEFDAELHRHIEALKNQAPPPAPRPMLPYAQVLQRLRLSEDEFVLAIRLNFPKAAGTEYQSRGTSIIGRTEMYSPDDIDRWLSLVRALSARLPPAI